MLTIASANVNGIRAARRRGMMAWLETRALDVLTLQEVRASDQVLREQLGPGWHVAHSEPTLAGHKGRAGVAVASRQPIAEVRSHLGDRFAGTGRWVEADIALLAGSAAAAVPAPGPSLLTVVSAYVHSGEAGAPRQDDKYAFLGAIEARMAELVLDGRHVLVTGDLNVAHREADLKNWKANVAKAGFLPAERAWFDRLLGEPGWVDVGRTLSGEGPGPYTWWSWRGKAFDADSGWRIDYQLASSALGALAVEHSVDRAASYAERWSDHAPVVVSYDVDRA